MTALRHVLTTILALRKALARSTSIMLRGVGRGLLQASHNTLALVGLAVVAAAIFVATRADIRQTVESTALGWLQARHVARAEWEPAPQAAKAAETVQVAVAAPVVPVVVPVVLPAAAPIKVEPPRPVATAAALPPATEAMAVSRATAADPRDLTQQQSAVAHWLARRYRVAPEPVSRLVKEAWAVAPRVGLDPTLILAIMAVESSFNPFAQSAVGAQGLMQVMTRVHDVKYARFGGVMAAFDPVTNLKVGVQVLKECIARAGSIEAGLRHYVGAANLASDGGYAVTVLAEQGHLLNVAGGRTVLVNARSTTAPVAMAAPVAAVVLRNAPLRPRAEPASAPLPVKSDDDASAPEQVALLR